MRKIVLNIFILLFTGNSFAQDLKTAVQRGHSGDIIQLGISPDEKILASADHDQLVLWDLTTGMQLTSKPFFEGLTGFGFTGSREITCNNRKSSAVYNILNDETIKINTTRYYTQRDSIPSGDTSYVIKDAKLLMYISGRQKKMRTTDHFDEGYTMICLPAKGKYLFAASRDGKVYVYDRRNLKPVTKLAAHRSAVYTLAVNNDATFLYSAGADRSIVEWDLKKLSLSRRLTGHSFRITSAVFHPNGKEIIFGNETGDVKSLSINQSLPEIKFNSLNFHPVVQLKFMINEKDTLLYAGTLSNEWFELNPNSLETVTSHKFINLSYRIFKRNVLEKIFSTYFKPAYNNIVIRPNENGKLIAVSASGQPGLRTQIKLFSIEKNKIKRLRYAPDNVIDLEWISENQLLVVRNQDGMRQSKLFPSEQTQFIESVVIRNNKIFSRRTDLPASGYYRLLKKDNQNFLIITDSTVFNYNSFRNELSILKQFSDSILFAEKINNHLLIADNFHRIHLYGSVHDLKSNPFILEGHNGRITSASIHPSKPFLLTSSEDATIKIWNVENGKAVATIIPVDKRDYAIQLASGEYQISKSAYKLFGFRYKDQFLFPDQFDLRFNKPHQVLASFGLMDSSTLAALEIAYHKRITKLGFSEVDFSNSYELPDSKIELLSQNSNTIKVGISADDKNFIIDRYNIYVNDVPVFGSKGKSIRNKNSKTLHESLEIKLINGTNRIDFSVTNEKGTESIRNSLVVNVEDKTKPEIFVVAFGCSNYKDSRFRLEYPAKDATDFTAQIKSFEKSGRKVHSRLYTDEKVTKESVTDARNFLAEASENDIVLVLVAGHGVLDNEFNYYFASYDMDFNNPSERGIEYSSLEALLDGIKPLRKLLFMDTCHSGEVEKDDVELASNNTTEDGEIKFRNSGAGIREKKGAGLVATSGLVKELFSDVRKGNGATVIASSGGAELSVEGDKWKNGLFTYCVIKGLRDKKADLNKDGILKVSELQKYVQKMVTELSNGKQIPNSRTENTILDFQLN
jgi:WD40 repeat protein